MRDLILIQSSYHDADYHGFFQGVIFEHIYRFYLEGLGLPTTLSLRLRKSFVLFTPDAWGVFRENKYKDFFVELAGVTDYTKWTTVERLQKEHSWEKLQLKVDQVRRMIDSET